MFSNKYFIICSFSFIIYSCQVSTSSSITTFESPQGLALGKNNSPQYLFVSIQDEDSLQVLEISSDFDNIEAIKACGSLFLLRIPAGPSPTSLVSTADGRFIVVLNPTINSLSLIDTETLSDVYKENEHLLFPVSPFSQDISTLIASPKECDEPCSGYIYASLKKSKLILEILVSSENGGQFTIENIFEIENGTPALLTLDKNAETLFVTLADKDELIRINLLNKNTDRINISSRSSPMAISSDNQYILVGRAENRDILLIENQEEMTIYDVNTKRTPFPLCLEKCNSLENICLSPHPADRSICVGDKELLTTEYNYKALYLGSVPQEIITINDSNPSQKILDVECINDSGSTITTQFKEFALISTLNGDLFFMGLRDTDNNFVPQIIDSTSCKNEIVSLNSTSISNNINPVLQDYLKPCSTTETDRTRIFCIPKEDPRIQIMPGLSTSDNIYLDWEGIILSQNEAIANIDNEGNIIDSDLESSLEDIKPNDIIEVLTNPLSTCKKTDNTSCLSSSNFGCCYFERRIVSINSNQLVLDQPLDKNCFYNESIAYNIRAGDQFVVRSSTNINTILGRVSQNEHFFDQGNTENSSASYSFQFQSFNTESTKLSCERYILEDNFLKPVSPMSPLLIRVSNPEDAISFYIETPYSPILAGSIVEDNGINTITRKPALPSTMIQAPLNDKTAVFVSSSLFKTLWAINPFNISDLDQSENQQLIP